MLILIFSPLDQEDPVNNDYNEPSASDAAFKIPPLEQVGQANCPGAHRM